MLDINFQNFRDHAYEQFPKECCGLLVIVKGKERYIPCRNVASLSMNFEIDPEDYAAAEDLGDIIAICHSHPNITSQPSEADKVSCERTNKPWYIFSLPNEHLNKIEPSGYTPKLIGRQYLTNVMDCYTLVQDYYRMHFGIQLYMFDRYDNWWLNEDLLTLDRAKDQGFQLVNSVKEIQTHDVIMMSNSSARGYLNHLAVYIGNEKIIHHCTNRLSCTDIYGGYWLKNTRYIMRYKDLC